MKRKLISLLLVLVMAFAVLPSYVFASEVDPGIKDPFDDNTPVQFDPKAMRDITAFDLVSEMNAGINIGNSMDSIGTKGEEAWGNPKITKELIQTYKKAGFNTIRLPITWLGRMGDNGAPYSNWLGRVQEVVDMILDEGLYCIINTHHEQSWLNTSDNGMSERKSKFKTLWTVIANRFIDYGDHLLFEGFNEILKKEGDWSAASARDYDNSNALAQVFVDAVRSTGQKNLQRTLIISTYGAGSGIASIRNFELPADSVKDRLAVEFHNYSPQRFCFIGSNNTQTSFGSDSDLSVINEYCIDFYNEFVKNKIPVILGEFGAVNKSNNAARVSYATKVAATCKENGIKPIWWDNGTLASLDNSADSFGLVDRNSYYIAFPEIISAIINNSSSSNLTDKPNPPVNPSASESSSSNATNAVKVGTVSGLKAVLTTADTVKISWNKLSNVTGYKIYKDGKYYKTVSNNSVTAKLTRGKTAKYKVMAYKIANGKTYNGAFSSQVNVTSFAKTVSKVVVKPSKTTANLKIKKVVGASGYEIKYSLKKSLKSAVKKNIKSTSVKLKKLKKNKKYYVTVRAYKTINGKRYYTTAKKLSFKTKK